MRKQTYRVPQAHIAYYLLPRSRDNTYHESRKGFISRGQSPHLLSADNHVYLARDVGIKLYRDAVGTECFYRVGHIYLSLVYYYLVLSFKLRRNFLCGYRAVKTAVSARGCTYFYDNGLKLCRNFARRRPLHLDFVKAGSLFVLEVVHCRRVSYYSKALGKQKVARKMVEVDETKARIPSFTLQPIVENAFVHGISSLEEGGIISLHVWEENQLLHVEISDNGVGIDEENLQRINNKLLKINTSGRGIGLGNISRRVDMMYENGSVTVNSKKGEGTTVSLIIPQNQ